MDRFWVPVDDLVWAPCCLVSSDDQGSTFETAAGVVSLPAAKAASLDRAHESQLEGVDDICTLSEVNDGAVLHTIRTRYARKLIYTRVSRVLVAVNPFQALPIYSAKYVDMFSKCNDSMEHEPHVYAIGSDAVRCLRYPAESQAVLISGESGAGKTETTKLILSYMSEVLPGTGDIQEQIMQINPILEAFGNAMTVRNNNSSRFGKWIELSVSKSTVVNSCSVTDYLLESTRVCAQGEHERNYHIFFQLMQARGESEMEELGIRDPSHYRYLHGSMFVAPGVDDARCFSEVKQALASLGFSQELQMDIFRVVIGILVLGNVEFLEPADHAEIQHEEPIQQAANLLGIDSETLRRAIVSKKIVVGKEVTVTQLSVSSARAARDGFSRLLYGRLFKWLIKRINGALHQDHDPGIYFGVLDIAGFENFAHNSLEQLFINLSNEHLQQHFNTHVFKMELDDYVKEGIDPGTELTYRDNADIVELISGRNGILPILDDEVSMPKATDHTLVNKIFTQHEKHRRFIPAKFKGDWKFGIRHFAGEVTYSCRGFLDKNSDKPPEEAPSILQSSSLTCLNEIAADIFIRESGRRISAERTKTAKTMSSRFRTSLAELFEKLNKASPHFIRCIKPNAEKKADEFTSSLVMEQLLSCGLMEAVKIRQQGFASRQPFDEFLSRYQSIVPKAARRIIMSADGPKEHKLQVFLDALPEAANAVVGQIKPGKNKVLAKASAVTLLEKSRNLAISGYAVEIQRYGKGMLVRSEMREARKILCKISEWHSRNDFYGKPGSDHVAMAKLRSPDAIDAECNCLEDLLDSMQKFTVCVPNLSKLKDVRHRMENETKVVRQYPGLAKTVDPMEIDKILARARDLELPKDADVQGLEKRVEQLKAQLPLVKAMQDALDTDDISQLQACMDRLKNEGLVKHPENWITELKGMELSGRVFDELDRLKAKKRNDELQKQRKTALDMQVTKSQATAFAVDEQAIIEKQKEDKRKTYRALVKISPQEQQDILSALDVAREEYDAVTLEDRLGYATRQGMNPDDLQSAQDLFETLQTETFVVSRIRELQDSIAGGSIASDPSANQGPLSTHTLKCLQNLIQQAQRIDVADHLIATAKPVMQQGVRRRARSTIKGSVFDHVNMSELQLGDGAFADISDFPNLKPAAQWAGHKKPGLLGGSLRGKGVMLSHCKLDIREPLTKVPRPCRVAAMQNFRNTIGWMGDRIVPEIQRCGYAQEIVETAKSDASLADEVYVQAMKQLTQNPSRRSEVLGWALMVQLCQQVTPSEGLEEFVRSFLLRALHEQKQEKEDDEISHLVKQCITDLNMTSKQVHAEQPDPELSTSPEGDADVVSVQVVLIDHSTRRIRIQSSSNLACLGKQVAEQLKVHNCDCFSFFQMIEGVDAHRLLPDNIVLARLLEKWKRFEERSGKTSRLIWKRRFLKVDEILQAGDLMHATLTYRQAVWDFLHYPISEDLAYICGIASMFLYMDRDHFKRFIDEKRLDEPGLLEQLLPDYTLRYESRKQLAAQVLKSYQELEKSSNLGGSRLQMMSSIMALMQKMRMFGTYFWSCRQAYSLPSERLSLPEAPSKMCKINPKDPDAEYWICVDFFGVRFMPLDSTPGNDFMRGFLLHDESVERVLRWGAKHDVLQLIVQTVNTGDVGAARGNLPPRVRSTMTVTVVCPAAVDIAHTLQCVARERKAQKNVSK